MNTDCSTSHFHTQPDSNDAAQDARKSFCELITFLRFPLAFLVVIFHWSSLPAFHPLQSRCTNAVLQGVSRHPEDAAQWFVFLLSNIWTCAVPLFFLISGYLFFLNLNGTERRFTPSAYAGKIRKRVHTLLIPYVIWILLTAIAMAAQSSYCHGCTWGAFWGSLRATVGGHGWHLFWDTSQNPVNNISYPLLVPLWYLRDLMVLALAGPVFYMLLYPLQNKWISGIRYLSLAAALIYLYVTKNWPFHAGLCCTPMLWFGAGCAISLNKWEGVLLRAGRCGVMLLPVTLAVFCAMALWMEDAATGVCWLLVRIITYVLLLLCAWRVMLSIRWRFQADYPRATMFIYCWHAVPFIGGKYIMGRLLEKMHMFGHGEQPVLLILLLILPAVIQCVAGVYLLKLWVRYSPRTAGLAVGK